MSSDNDPTPAPPHGDSQPEEKSTPGAQVQPPAGAPALPARHPPVTGPARGPPFLVDGKPLPAA